MNTSITPDTVPPDNSEGEDYPALESARWFITAAAQNFAIRFGPFDAPRVSEIIKQANAEGIGLLLVAVCGQDVDWNALRAFKQDRPLGPDVRDVATTLSAVLHNLRQGSVPDEAEIAEIESLIESAMPQ